MVTKLWENSLLNGAISSANSFKGVDSKYSLNKSPCQFQLKWKFINFTRHIESAGYQSWYSLIPRIENSIGNALLVDPFLNPMPLT